MTLANCSRGFRFIDVDHGQLRVGAPPRQFPQRHQRFLRWAVGLDHPQGVIVGRDQPASQGISQDSFQKQRTHPRTDFIPAPMHRLRHPAKLGGSRREGSGTTGRLQLACIARGRLPGNKDPCQR